MINTKIHNYIIYLCLLCVAVLYCLLLFITIAHERIYAFTDSEISITAQPRIQELDITLLAIHPEAAKQPTSVGKTITDLAIYDGMLYAGYGDYGTNTGPIHLNPLNAKTGKFIGRQLEVPSEALLRLRSIGGNLYAPMTDPDRPALQDAGYARLSEDGWINQFKAPAIHVYDMASLTGTDLWMVGSAMAEDGKTGKGAIAYRSMDGGETWAVAMEGDVSRPERGFERYYWIATLHNKIYMQASSVMSAAPLRIYDGTAWATGTTEELCRPHSAVEVFQGYIICTRGTELSLFNGTMQKAATLPSSPHCDNGAVNDIHIGDDNWLYILKSSGCIIRTKNLLQWEILSNSLANARSIAIYNGKVYLGTAEAEIFVAEL